MSAVIVNIEFTEMKKNKKESLKFTLKGDDSQGIGKRLYDLAGSIVHMEIKDCAVGKFPAEFVDIKKSAKGVVANFLLKGDLSDEKSGQIYSHSGGTAVELTLESSQMSIEDFHDPETEWVETEGDEKQAGLEVKVDASGTVELVAKSEDPMAAFIEETKAIQEPSDDDLPI
ncbi:hypothetical protein EHS13_20020 [Paenibacillus psychroresistens]|uniref:Uncharacterized protein n=1 Tax=Paenibacillus psychroresistens TaxID=1778678 RepID=A0A6B8RMC4_9BACL|nr:hypothetical protein [Paenibacillus psychroresistens]QGQ97007.1 hypothetical protein EHS13_20020 [Paenibacillus psychroresistens]